MQHKNVKPVGLTFKTHHLPLFEIDRETAYNSEDRTEQTSFTLVCIDSCTESVFNYYRDIFCNNTSISFADR